MTSDQTLLERAETWPEAIAAQAPCCKIERDAELLTRYRRLRTKRKDLGVDRIEELERTADAYETAVSLANGPVPSRSAHWRTRVEPAREKLRKAIEGAERVAGK